MKFRSRPRIFAPIRTHSIIRWGQYCFFIIGIVVSGYCAFVLLDTMLYQAYQTRRFEQELTHSLPPSVGRKQLESSSLLSVPADGSNVTAGRSIRAGSGSHSLGQIEIGALGLKAMILEGTGEKALQRGVGHIVGTALPGQGGNVGIAGHRDTFFRALRLIRKNDEINVRTLQGSRRYRVDSTKVVGPEATEVLNRSSDPILTLVTCYPFSFVGPAPKRFIVRAHGIDSPRDF